MINPSFTRGEYWLLESVAGHAIPICWLDWEGLNEMLNKVAHGMPRVLLVETMQKLFADGLIVAHRDDRWDDCLVLTSQQIEVALDDTQRNKDHCYYGLTAKGGKYWEAFALPDWNFYIHGEYTIPESNGIVTGELACMKKDILETYFRSLCYHDYDVDEKTIVWDVLNPWKATYWKELPQGYRVRFCGIQKEKDINTDTDIIPTTPITINFTYDQYWYPWQ